MTKKNQDDWNFKVETHEDAAKPKAPVSKTGVHRLLQRKPKEEAEVKLDYKSVPKRVSRSNAEHYINTNQHSSGDLDTSMALISTRGLSLVIDGAFWGAYWVTGKMYTEPTFNFVFEQFKKLELENLLVFPQVRLVINALNFLVLYFIVHVLIAGFTSKTPGKFIMKIVIDDLDGGHIGLFRTFMREMIYKPLSFITIIGALMPLFDKKRRALHDRLSTTVVRKEGA